MFPRLPIIELKLMIEESFVVFASIIALTAVCITMKVPFKLTLITLSKLSKLSLVMKLSRTMPAALTMIVGGFENCFVTSLNAAWILPSSVTCTCNAICPSPIIRNSVDSKITIS